jgi:ribulose-5-phosphate 4-epimerase/fuculose-1-phosphate aldolase
MSPNDLKQQTLANLRGGLNFLPGSNEASAAMVIGLHLAALGTMRQHGYITAEEAVMEARTLFAAVEDAHPGRWEALGGPPMPDALKA